MREDQVNRKFKQHNKGLNMRAAIQKTDTEIKTQVLSELQYEPSVKATDIGVLVKDGTVTLNGFATSYGEKWNAVRATKRVAGGHQFCLREETCLISSPARQGVEDNNLNLICPGARPLAWALSKTFLKAKLQ
jgi:hypothetical protein